MAGGCTVELAPYIGFEYDAEKYNSPPFPDVFVMPLLWLTYL